MPRFVVLGAGLVGGYIARVLSEGGDAQVTSVDRDEAVLARLPASVTKRTADLSSATAIGECVADADVVIGAVPGFMGFAMLRAVIDAGKPCVDISFAPEDLLALDGPAKERGVPIVVDCGVAPGFASMLVAHLFAKTPNCDSVEILVAGLPIERRWPFEYKAGYSPIDVIEEYTRPVTVREHGKLVVKPALSDLELVDLPDVGTLEAFNTDGLRSLLTSLPDLPNLRERTMRYPGHAERMRMLRETGFFSEEPITTRSGERVRPLDVTAALLFKQWKLTPGVDRELTVMRVEARGRDASGKPVIERCDTIDRMAANGDSSMARMTGIPCMTAARLVAEGKITTAGIVPPEKLATEAGLFNAIVDGLKSHGVNPHFSTVDGQA